MAIGTSPLQKWVNRFAWLLIVEAVILIPGIFIGIPLVRYFKGIVDIERAEQTNLVAERQRPFAEFVIQVGGSMSINPEGEIIECRFYCTTINDDQLAQISDIETIQFLDISGTNVTSKSVPIICNLKNLNVLYTSDTGLSNDDRRRIKGCFPEIRFGRGDNFTDQN